jgi:diphosphomevalonate decarboxylase
LNPETGAVLVKKEEWSEYHVHISSVNTFPTGAGLASSAAGLACFVRALAELYCVKEECAGQLTAIARQGSGSASRSMYGGFVRWQKGNSADGSDSIAIQVADENVSDCLIFVTNASTLNLTSPIPHYLSTLA